MSIKHSHTPGDFRFDCAACKKSFPKKKISGFYSKGGKEVKEITTYELPKDFPANLGKPHEAQYILHLVSSHEGLVEDLAICLHVFGKDMQNDFRRRIERHLKEAIQHETKI